MLNTLSSTASFSSAERSALRSLDPTIRLPALHALHARSHQAETAELQNLEYRYISSRACGSQKLVSQWQANLFASAKQCAAHATLEHHCALHKLQRSATKSRTEIWQRYETTRKQQQRQHRGEGPTILAAAEEQELRACCHTEELVTREVFSTTALVLKHQHADRAEAAWLRKVEAMSAVEPDLRIQRLLDAEADRLDEQFVHATTLRAADLRERAHDANSALALASDEAEDEDEVVDGDGNGDEDEDEDGHEGGARIPSPGTSISVRLRALLPPTLRTHILHLLLRLDDHYFRERKLARSAAHLERKEAERKNRMDSLRLLVAQNAYERMGRVRDWEAEMARCARQRERQLEEGAAGLD